MNAGEIISLRLLASYVPQPLADITTWVACVCVWKVCSQQWRLEAHFGEWGRCAFFAQIAAHLVILTSVDVLLFFCWYLAAVFLLMPALCLLLSLLWRLWRRCIAKRCLNTSILLSLSLNIALVRNCWCQGSLSGTSRLLGFLGKTLSRQIPGKAGAKGQQNKCQCWSVRYLPSWWSERGMCWKEHLALFCHVLTISGTSVASHHHLPIFCSFRSLSSWRNLCVINISSFHLHGLPPKLFLGRCLLWVSQSACVACGPPAMWCHAGVCGVKSEQLVFLKMSWSRFFAGPLSGDPHTWVTHHPCASHML